MELFAPALAGRSASKQAEAIGEAIAAVHARMSTETRADNKRPSGTTIAGIWAPNGAKGPATVFNVGDSPVFHFSKGRIAVHIITGGSDEEMAKDGDHTNKAERYARTDEYLDIVRQEWTSAKPFDYKGNYYDVVQGFGAVKPLQQPHIPIYFGGSSDEAIPVAGKHADIFALWGETQAQVRETIARVRAAACSYRGPAASSPASTRRPAAASDARGFGYCGDESVVPTRARTARRIGGAVSTMRG